ncbi:RIN4, pathogenic type III effector avirulence factor Avr cleavage site [Melia azedarach]|uniref:RIN4, pathogenic type III effector avirulence factor Avr cleavage site n=1 Tax=Melia azedarach TaxID=155640 RepID=A0ACC1YL27_MELAZ|nr:RIN4, pathogenic type III effector avirulence factor Avr cleavage site [Melia azedarach]
MTVPQFGGWDQKAPGATDYSMVFSRARANRKQQKADARRSFGNEQEILAAQQQQQHHHHHHQQEEDSVMRKKKILTYINCCIRP